MLRGALAVVLRSVGAVDARCNYCALATDPAQRCGPCIGLTKIQVPYWGATCQSLDPEHFTSV